MKWILGLLLAVVTLPAFAAATFYWPAESTTLSTESLSADTSATPFGGVSLDAAAKHNGSFGVLNTNQQDYYTFDPTGICSVSAGTLAGWVQFKSTIPSSGNRFLLSCQNSGDSSIAAISMGSSQEARMELSNGAGTTLNLLTTACNFAVDNWYFIVGTYDIAADDRKISCYNSSGTLIDSTTDTSTDLSGSAPASFDVLRAGNTGSHTGVMWTDNFFLADSYDFSFLPFRDITTYIPTYTSGPTIGTPNSTTIPNTYTADQDGTTYAAACTNGQTISTGANVESGTCSGGAAVGTGSDASVATVSDSVTITGLAGGTTYDVYLVHKSSLGGYSAVASKPDQATTASSPSFDTGIACSAVDTNSISCTYDANVTANRIFLCAKAKGSTAPADGTAVEAGTGCSGTATENTTGSSDSLQIDFSGDPLAEQDIWGVLETGSSNYSTLSSDLITRFTAPSGYQYLNKTSDLVAPAIGLFDLASPAIATDDTMQVSLLADSYLLGAGAHAVTLNVDSTYEVATGGDLSRQLIYRRFSDYSVPAWSDASAVAYSINDIAPAYIGDNGDFEFVKDASVSLPLDSEWLDMEADSVTHAVTNMPAGGTLTASETITGAFTTCGTYSTVSLTATDAYGEDTSQSVTFEVGASTPDVVGLTGAAAIAAISALCSLTAVADASQYSDTVAVGLVISQQPDAGEFSIYNQSVNYVLSLGVSPDPPADFLAPNLEGMTVAQAEAAVIAAAPWRAGQPGVVEGAGECANPPEDLVVGQTPASGATVGAFDDISISLGYVPLMPDLIGMTLAEAAAILAALCN